MLEFSFHPFPELESKRLVLRRLQASDASALYALRSDPNVLTYLDRPPAASVEAMESMIHSLTKDWMNNENINWAISLKGKDELIGTICFWKIAKEHHRGEIGYMLLSDYHRQGIMQEAIILTLDYGFRQMKLHSVEANVNPNNEASIQLLQKNGFVQEAYFKENYYYDGDFVDSAIFSLLEKNWKNSKFD